MALIKCVDCGKEFSNRASACPNCGCPTEVVLEELENSIKKRNIVATYDIWGYKFSLDKSDITYISLVKTIREQREKILDSVTDQYYQFGSIDRLVEELPEFYSNVLDIMVSNAVSSLNISGIYDCDTDAFMKKYGASFDLTSLMEPIITRFLEIQNFEQEAIEYREYLRQQRLNTWSGGGFGIEGALKGYFKAQLMNIGTEFLHFHSDNINHNKNMAEVAKAKKNLYENENTKSLVINALMDTYDICFNAVIEELKVNGILSNTLFEETKARCIFNNIIVGINSDRVDLNVIKEQCLSAFKYDPAFQNLIELMLDIDESPNNNDLIEYADDFGFYELYLQHVQSNLKNKYREYISKITEVDIATNVLFKDALKQCITLKEHGLDITEILEDVCHSRIKYPMTSDELSELEKWINSESLGLDEDQIDCFMEILDDVEVTDVNAEELNELIKMFCAKYAQNQKDDFCFLHDSKIDIRKQDEFKDFEKCCSLPLDAHVYMTYSVYHRDEPETLIALTDKGIYIYDGWFYDRIFLSWKEYADSKIEVNWFKLTLDGNTFKFCCSEDLEKLFFDLHKELCTYFETGKSKYVYNIAQWEKAFQNCEDDFLDNVDLDLNKFVENFCLNISKEYDTKITTFDLDSTEYTGFNVFWVCRNSFSDIKEYWNRYKEYWEFDDNVKLYAMDAFFTKYNGIFREHSVLFTDKGIYIYISFDEEDVFSEGEWIDLAFVDYYLIDGFKFNSSIVIEDEQYSLGGRAIRFIVKLRNALRQFVINNSKEVRKHIEKEARLTPRTTQVIWNICKSYYPGPKFTEYNHLHTFLLSKTDKRKKNYKAPKERLEYLADRIDLHIPEEDEVYYMFSCNKSKVYSYCENDKDPRLGIYITNSGIYWYDRTDGFGFEDWYSFAEDELRLKKREGIFLDNQFIYLKEESNFAFKILKEIQDYLKTLGGMNIIMPKLYAYCPNREYDHEDWVTPVLKNKTNITVFSWFDSDLVDVIRYYAPEIEEMFTKINLKEYMGGTGVLLHLIYLKNLNKGILVSQYAILCKNTIGNFAVKYEDIERFELGRNKSNKPCLFIYIRNGGDIVKGFIEIDEESLDIDVTTWNNVLKEFLEELQKIRQRSLYYKIQHQSKTE